MYKFTPKRLQTASNRQGPNSIEIFWLEFLLKIYLNFWLEIRYSQKMFKNGVFRPVSESRRHLSPFFKPKLELLNWVPANNNILERNISC